MTFQTIQLKEKGVLWKEDGVTIQTIQSKENCVFSGRKMERPFKQHNRKRTVSSGRKMV